jgi:predicted ATPase/RsiW-degrading membrane proteinase PrsW (M82 family)
LDGIFGNPAFLFTYAVIQAAVLLVLVRFLDFYDRQPLSLVALVAAWGATGAALLSLVGNEAVKGLLGGDVREVFGDAIAPPLVEEAAKGIALLAAVGPIRWLARRAGVTLFEGVGAGVVYGAAVGLGFAFTEDIYFLIDRARTEGLDAGFETFLIRRDFFGPAILHHALFTGAFGAGLGLATWSTRRTLKVVFPLVGFALAVLLHAVNNGLVELILVLDHGVEETAAWVRDAPVSPALETAADNATSILRVIDFFYLVFFFGVMALWASYQRRLILSELEEEVDSGLISGEELERTFDVSRRAAGDWALLRSGQLERLRHQRRLRHELARLGLLKWRTRRFGGEWSRVQRARREIATVATYEVAQFDVPVPPGPLIGRERELEEIHDLLAQHDVRLVTLTGPGGIGKTRLAIEIASRERDRFASGVYYVELTSLTDAELVPAAIATALKLKEIPGEPLIETLKDFLRDAHLLLVLDNFERVIGAAASVAGILAVAGRVTVLVTSREPLRIAGEHDHPVRPLELPQLEARVAPDALGENAAVALFVDRARALRPDFGLTAANAAAVAEICIRLDGLPLAIELAAGRMNVLSPYAILERLGNRLQVLTGGGRDLPSRHQALRSTIDWSYDLLAAGDQALFARLGVFVDGATAEAIEAVCRPAADDSHTVLDGLASLVDKSLVRRMDGVADEARFAMLETIREYAVERLRERGELSELRRRHARQYMAFAEEAEHQLVRADQALWGARLDQEMGNLRSALAWCRESDELEVGLRAVAALYRFWSMRGSTEGPRWLSEALDLDLEVPPDVQAKALFADGYAALDPGQYARARQRFEESLAIYRELDDARGAAMCLAQLGWVLATQQEYERAAALSEESVELARRVGDPQIESVAVSGQASGVRQARDYDRARDLHERSLALRRQLGDHRNIANALLNLGRIEILRGEHERAHALLEEGVAIAREVGDAWSISVGIARLGQLALRKGRDREAVRRLRQALDLTLQQGGTRLAAECLDGLAEATSAREPARAARLWGAAERVRRQIGVSLSSAELALHEAPEAEARSVLGEDEFRKEWEAGLSLRLEDAVNYAFSDSRASLSSNLPRPSSAPG